MNILVCISKVPDTTSKISFIDSDTKFNEDKVTYIVNPYDEWYALVRALEIKETLGGTVTIISVGGSDAEAIIRKALAIGADEAVRVDFNPTESFQVADAISAYAKSKNYDIILTGKETIDYNGSEVGGMIAEMLNVPFISLATKLDIVDGKAKTEIDIEGGVEIITSPLPCVISAAKGMAEARIPNMRGIMAARTKTIEIVSYSSEGNLVSVSKFALPPAKSSVKLIDPSQPEQLIELLHNEAKVI